MPEDSKKSAHFWSQLGQEPRTSNSVAANPSEWPKLGTTSTAAPAASQSTSAQEQQQQTQTARRSESGSLQRWLAGAEKFEALEQDPGCGQDTSRVSGASSQPKGGARTEGSDVESGQKKPPVGFRLLKRGERMGDGSGSDQ